jgi:serine/threonine protein kinase
MPDENPQVEELSRREALSSSQEHESEAAAPCPAAEDRCASGQAPFADGGQTGMAGEAPSLDFVAASAASGSDAAPAEVPGTRIGSYKLLQKLGEGGMGTVFLAEQTEPVRRSVALKIIKAGMDSRQVLARFDAERQALALMDHPNIARVLDAGTTDSGRPFFVMELVKGIPITRYCDQECLSPRDRLALFLPVCQAVQHAHQKGIIHRDLKPSNVLVALYDGRPVPKVIDFGLAKATGQKLTEQTLFTEIGTIVGTLEYMAPEQAELNNLDIDTRADIYALGVLLYELLTGTPPFTRQQLLGTAFTEMIRIIREVEPPRPSLRLSSAADLPATAARRKLEPKKLAQFLRGDLDWIVMKCLAKERGRRYETSNGLAMDLQRFLADEPVLARPPSAGYRLRKFVRRHRGAVLAAAFVLLALLAGVVGTSVGLAQARRAQAEAQQQARKAEQAAAAERKANELLESLFTGLNPWTNRFNEPDVYSHLIAQLNDAVARLDRDPPEPLTLARLQDALGWAFSGLGETNRAVAQLERSFQTRTDLLGDAHPDTLQSLAHLGTVYRSAGRFDKAVPLLEKALAGRRLVLGPDHADTLRSMTDLADVYRVLARFDPALDLLERVVAKQRDTLGEDDPDTLSTLSALGSLYRDAGRHKEALALLRKALDRREKVLGPKHPNTLYSMYNLASAYLADGQRQLAVEWFERAWKEHQRLLGDDHPRTLFCATGLADAYRGDKQTRRAIELLEKTLEKQKEKPGPNHIDTLRTMNALAAAYREDKQFGRAIGLFEQALEKRRKLYADYPATFNTMQSLAQAYRDAGKLAPAAALLAETLRKRKAMFGDDYPGTLETMHHLALTHRLDRRLDKAVPLFEQALAGRTRVLGPEHPNTLATLRNLAVTYEEQKRWDKAEPLRARYVDTVSKQNGADELAVATELAALGVNLQRQQKYAEAEERLRAALEIRDRKQPDDWTTFQTRSLLGAMLLGQKEYDKAEPLLLAGYQGLKERQAQMPANQQARLTEAVNRLVQLYKAWDKADEAKRWENERDALRAATEPKK